jgi:hypothetical protein
MDNNEKACPQGRPFHYYFSWQGTKSLRAIKYLKVDHQALPPVYPGLGLHLVSR